MTSKIIKLDEDQVTLEELLEIAKGEGLEPENFGDMIVMTNTDDTLSYEILGTPKTPKSGEGPAKREGTPIAPLEATGCKAPKTQQGQRRYTHPGGWPFNSY